MISMKLYAGDLSEREWAILDPLIPQRKQEPSKTTKKACGLYSCQDIVLQQADML